MYQTNKKRSRLSARSKFLCLRLADSSQSLREFCKRNNIPRSTIDSWKKKLEANLSTQLLKPLKDGRISRRRQFAKVRSFYNQASREEILTVLQVVAKQPEASVAKIVSLLPQVNNKPLIGQHGVQNILKRYALSHLTDRLIYARKFAPIVEIPTPVTGEETRTSPQIRELTPQELPAPPALDFAQGKPVEAISPASFRSRLKRLAKYFSFSSLASVIIFSFLIQLGGTFLSARSTGETIGLVFGSIALAIGSAFFLYSLKYYLTIAIVLAFSRQIQDKDINQQTSNQNPDLLDNQLKGIKSGLIPDVSGVVLERMPFVSIHLPIYNEKLVVNRLLEAVTSMDYPNFEVIVCDDSTDETKDIVLDWKNHPRIKILHRENREGFKGGALKEALKLMDPRTEFILVFDSDFLPYPDTITQFLKYFKATAGSLQPTTYNLQPVAAVQGYQWHVLNKSENWITRGVRSEYAGSYVIERSGAEIYGGLKQIAGSVYIIRADLLKAYGWGTSITEDFELTLKLYRDGYKVVYTPYIQAPSECVSTLKRLIRQRMRWAEGHSFNIKRMFASVLKSSRTTVAEKLELAYLSPYYLQSFFFLLGTFSWFIADAVFRVRLPFWTQVWGWSLVLTNLLSLPLMNLVGMFLEESEQKDYLGIFSFVILTYILAPFQAYASVKGFLEVKEGPWFRTPKTGKITDIFQRGRFYRWLSGILPGRSETPAVASNTSFLPNKYLVIRTANSQFNSFSIVSKKKRWVGKLIFSLLLAISVTIYSGTKGVPEVLATNPSGTFLLYNDTSAVITSPTSWQLRDTGTPDTLDTTTTTSFAKNGANSVFIQWKPGATNSTSETANCSDTSFDGTGWVWDSQFGDTGQIASGTWSITIRESDNNANPTVDWDVCVWRVTVSGGSITSAVLLFETFDGTNHMTGWPTTDIFDNAVSNPTATTATVGPFNLSNEYLYVEYYIHGSADTGAGGTRSATFATGDVTETTDPRIVTPAITIPENAILFLVASPIIPYLAHLWIKKKNSKT